MFHRSLRLPSQLFTHPPWRYIFTSPAVWGIVAGHTAVNWQFYTLLTQMPTYFHDILGFRINANGFLSALPYSCLFLTVLGGGKLADYLRSEHILSTKNVRRYFTVASLVGSSFFLVLTGFIGCSRPLQVICLIASTAVAGLAMGGGYNLSHLDVAPRYAGTLMGLSNAFATIPGFVSPELTGALTTAPSTRSQWQTLFYISAAISLVGAALFFGLIDGEVQSWAVEAPEDGDDSDATASSNNAAINSDEKTALYRKT